MGMGLHYCYPSSDLFKTQDKISQDECIKYAQKLFPTTVTPVAWQGFHSYTLLSGSNIIQFRSDESPLDVRMTDLAKIVHGDVAPKTSYDSCMPNSSISVWIMEALPGVGYLSIYSDITVAKMHAAVSGLAKFFSSAWNHPQQAQSHTTEFYKTKLRRLSSALPGQFVAIIERIRRNLNDLVSQVPWVLTHADLSNMNILVDPNTGHLTGIVDWADATIEPFGVALWGLESLLGCSGSQGWTYYKNDVSSERELFWSVLISETRGTLSDRHRSAIEELRILGLLMRFGFNWVDGALEPTQDTALLGMFL